MGSHGLWANDIVNEIRSQNIQAAAGVVGAPPGGKDVDLQLSVNAEGRLQSEDEFGDIVVKTGQSGEVTRLRDFARIELGAADYSLRSLLDNETAVGIGVFPAPNSNALEVSRGIRAAMAELKKDMPEGVDYGIVYDTTQFVRASIDGLLPPPVNSPDPLTQEVVGSDLSLYRAFSWTTKAEATTRV